MKVGTRSKTQRPINIGRFLVLLWYQNLKSKHNWKFPNKQTPYVDHWEINWEVKHVKCSLDFKWIHERAIVQDWLIDSRGIRMKSVVCGTLQQERILTPLEKGTVLGVLQKMDTNGP